MRVLHVFKTFFPATVGGVEEVIRQTVLGTQVSAIESEVLTLGESSCKFEFEGIPVHQFRTTFRVAGMPVSLSALATIRKLVSEFDIIHHHFPNPFGDLLALVAASSGKPIVSTYHSDVVKQEKLNAVYEPLRERFLRRVSKIVATSPQYLASSSVLASHAEKVCVIPLGLPIESGLSSAGETEIGSLRLGGERFNLFVGALRYYKGLHTLLEAAAISESRIPIVIAGIGKLREELEDRVEELGLKHVHIVGAVSEGEKGWLLRHCEAFLFPSHLRSEAFGVSLLEASACSKPMISCEIGTGTSFVNLHGVTGLVVEADAPQSFADAIDHMASDSVFRMECGRNARSRFERHFTSDKAAESYVQLYRSLLR
ncbi:MAG: glycosyltransferase [Verrucomicrobiales bacterium]|nr:glycosyltransferase [Verrucomicrobiales bacterium]